MFDYTGDYKHWVAGGGRWAVLRERNLEMVAGEVTDYWPRMVLNGDINLRTMHVLRHVGKKQDLFKSVLRLSVVLLSELPI